MAWTASKCQLKVPVDVFWCVWIPVHISALDKAVNTLSCSVSSSWHHVWPLVSVWRDSTETKYQLIRERSVMCSTSSEANTWLTFVTPIYSWQLFKCCQFSAAEATVHHHGKLNSYECVCVYVFQDWEFPHFMGDLDMNLPGMSTTHVKVRLPVCKRIFKEEYHIHITGTGTAPTYKEQDHLIVFLRSNSAPLSGF